MYIIVFIYTLNFWGHFLSHPVVIYLIWNRLTMTMKKLFLRISTETLRMQIEMGRIKVAETTCGHMHG
jgi:hypothetical protein